MRHLGNASQSHAYQRNREGGHRTNLIHTRLLLALSGRRVPYIEIPMHIDSHLRRKSQWRRRADSNRRIEVLQTSALVHLATAPHIDGPAVAESTVLFRPLDPGKPPGPANGSRLVPRGRLELPQPCGHSALNAARLPIPPPRRALPRTHQSHIPDGCARQQCRGY